jgi:hypothetical protein
MTLRTTLQNSVAALALSIIIGGGALAQDGGIPIPQPKVDNLPVADASKRVDLTLPKFSRPTEVTNPWFPVSKQESVLHTGVVDGKAFRTEVTLLPYTRIVEWNGIRIETLVSQYTAFLDGRIQEVAFDLYAQADDGSVWYFGEDVSDFKDGLIFSKEGTWLAGKDGPPNMIMPGKPKVGDVFRAENMPGIAFEEVTLTSVDNTIDGPLGPITGVVTGSELHMDGKTLSEKNFGPSYGEIRTVDKDSGDIEAMTLGIPVDALSGPVPAELTALTDGALSIFKAAGDKDWKSAAESAEAVKAVWEKFSTGDMPKPIKPLLGEASKALTAAVGKRNAAKARQAAIETARWAFDLQLRHRPVAEINLARFDLWAAQVLVDAAAKNAGAVTGDMFTLMLIRDRILAKLDADTAQSLNIQLGELMTAAADEEFDAASEAAGQLRQIVAGVKPAL